MRWWTRVSASMATSPPARARRSGSSKVTASSEALNAALAALRRARRPRQPNGDRGGDRDARANSATSTSGCATTSTSDQQLMAADVIFTEGSDAAATAARQVETARLAEHQAFDRDVAELRKQQAVIARSRRQPWSALVVLLLIPVRRAAGRSGWLEDSSRSRSPRPALGRAGRRRRRAAEPTWPRRRRP